MEDSAQVDSPAEIEEVTMENNDMDVVPNELANDIEEELAGVVKVSNISPQANTEQMKKLFGFLGNVQELALYPKGLVLFFDN